MLCGVKKLTLGGIVCLFSILLFSQTSSAQQYACLPTCNIVDAKFLVLSGTQLISLNNDRISFGIRSPEGSTFVELGVFDGDQGNLWEINVPGADLVFTLYADPNNEGAENFKVNEWQGDTMPDNDWFVINQLNAPEAQTPDGDYIYKLTVRNLNPGVFSSNSFKLRTDGRIKVLPFEIFSFISSIGSNTDLEIIYPNIFDPACGEICNPEDPDCCLETTYDGDWCFSFILPEDVERIEMFDGDFDYGSSVPNAMMDDCIADGIEADTDDPNTPNDELFPWTIGTEVVFEGAALGNPFDNACFDPQVRNPSVIYSLEGPEGTVVLNDNPSGTSEWERFSVTTSPLDPTVDDVTTPNLEPGQWFIKVYGLDQANLNVLRFPYAINGEDENGEPVPFDPEDPAQVPTMSEWGLVALSALVLIASVYYLRRKRAYN